jgi:hypothetical protein
MTATTSNAWIIRTPPWAKRRFACIGSSRCHNRGSNSVSDVQHDDHHNRHEIATAAGAQVDCRSESLGRSRWGCR